MNGSLRAVVSRRGRMPKLRHTSGQKPAPREAGGIVTKFSFAACARVQIFPPWQPRHPFSKNPPSRFRIAPAAGAAGFPGFQPMGGWIPRAGGWGTLRAQLFPDFPVETLPPAGPHAAGWKPPESACRKIPASEFVEIVTKFSFAIRGRPGIFPACPKARWQEIPLSMFSTNGGLKTACGRLGNLPHAPFFPTRPNPMRSPTPGFPPRP